MRGLDVNQVLIELVCREVRFNGPREAKVSRGLNYGKTTKNHL